MVESSGYAAVEKKFTCLKNFLQGMFRADVLLANVGHHSSFRREKDLTAKTIQKKG
jgi:hypothetical protein